MRSASRTQRKTKYLICHTEFKVWQHIGIVYRIIYDVDNFGIREKLCDVRIDICFTRKRQWDL